MITKKKLCLGLILFVSMVNVLFANTESLGHYWNGKIKNAQKLPSQGEGYVMVREERHNQYGHPSLIHFIQTLSSQAKQKHLGVVKVGDLSRQGGGRIQSLHRSHQNGLDVDIFFDGDEEGHMRSVLNRKDQMDFKIWKREFGEMMKLASLNPSVDRVFIHPKIKAQLCKTYPKEKWLQKVHPIKGHKDHFHVRLQCPHDSPHCSSQPSFGVGC